MFARSSEAADRGAIEVHLLSAESLDAWRQSAGAVAGRWLEASGFQAEAGTWLLVPDCEGEPHCVLAGRDPFEPMWSLAGLPAVLPAGLYRLSDQPADAEFERLALGWAFGHYRFDRYKQTTPREARLVVDDQRFDRLTGLAASLFGVRDRVNTPAADLGPAELAGAARELAERHGAAFSEVAGKKLERGFPAIHAVGQASSRSPRLIRLEWGEKSNPPLALVGKGVVFDTGGLDIKAAAGMLLMKKDMGGAAHALGLAELIMRFELPVHLRLYIPAVENSISGNAYRPSDIVTTRNGTTVEIGNTDAEGRVVLSDALTLAAEEGAARIIDFATLTGAARVALGEDLPPLYARDTARARAIQDLSFELEDPLWHMPLYRPYKKQIQPKIADLSNTGTSSFGGSLTAALFLDHFVPEGIDWMHLDIYAWNTTDRPGRPAGGEAQCLRALFAWLENEYRG